MILRLDFDEVRQMVEGLYITMVAKEHGDIGILELKRLLADIRKIYQFVEPEICQESIIIFRSLNNSPVTITGSDPLEIVNFERFPQEGRGALVIQVRDNDTALLWRNPSLDVSALARNCVVYRYYQRTEAFHAGSSFRTIPKINPGYASLFAIPTFSDLRDALEHYNMKFARYCSCKILARVWHDEKRIFLKNAQEHIMRDSLTQFLKSAFRGDVEVRPEQIVDESHPVDIKVTWMFSNRLALIEIKWLGTPKYEDGHLGKAYTDFRAREGAQQLADYLDENKKQVPTHVTKGYLVLIDGRRAGLNETTTSVSREDGLYYRDREIHYEPKFHEIRDDFEVPVRMFVEPVCRV